MMPRWLALIDGLGRMLEKQSTRQFVSFESAGTRASVIGHCVS